MVNLVRPPIESDLASTPGISLSAVCHEVERLDPSDVMGPLNLTTSAPMASLIALQ